MIYFQSFFYKNVFFFSFRDASHKERAVGEHIVFKPKKVRYYIILYCIVGEEYFNFNFRFSTVLIKIHKHFFVYFLKHLLPYHLMLCSK